MLPLEEVRGLIPDVDLSDRAYASGGELIVSRAVPEGMATLGGQLYLVDRATRRVKKVTSSILDWPDWFADGEFEEVRLP